MKNRYLDKFINRALPIADLSCRADQNARNAGHEHPIVQVITEGLTMAKDSNRSRKNYARYAMTSKKVFFNIPATKRAKTRHVPIMWMDEDEKGVLYPHEDALVIKAIIASKKFD